VNPICKHADEWSHRVSTVDMERFIGEIEAEAREYLATRSEATLIVGLSVMGERHILSFRSPGAKLAPLPEPDTIYEIGSVSKVYTTTILAALEGQGLLSLDDPISSYLPKSLRLPPQIAAITIRQLATHSSGLGSIGKEHEKIIAEESRGTEPPYGAYTHYLRYRKEHLYADLENAELDYPTGQGWVYSIIGMGTLGHILELVTDTPYEGLLKETICEPLGLVDTGYTLSADQQRRVMTAYDSDGQPTPNWYHDVLLPQGGLRSTMTDMLTFAEAGIRASIDSDASNLAHALRRTREPHYRRPAGSDFVGMDHFLQGLAWWGLEHPSGPAWWHGGTTLFYLSSLGIDEHAQVGCVALSSYRRSLLDIETFHTLQRNWFQRAARQAIRPLSDD
jgi:CubicO group peptidase (beta-lactamase class C family)